MDDLIINSLYSTLDKIASISVTDISGKIIYVNDAFLKVTKYSREELIGQNHRILKSGFHPDSFYSEMWKTISSGKTWRGELKNKNKEGAFYWVDSTVAPVFDENNKITGYVAIRFQIDERKKLERSLAEKIKSQIKTQQQMSVILEQLKADKEKLEEAMSKDEFLSIAAHHLRTPLGTMRWSLELIKSNHFGPVPDSLQAVIDNMVEDNLELIYLVNELLDVTKINQNRIVERPTRFDVYDTVQSEIDKIKILSDKKSINIIQEIDALKNVSIVLDQKLFVQVITNLLSNAIKYNKVKGRISIFAKKNNDFFRIEVADTGIGIPQNDLKNVFSKFFRATNVSISEIEGTGLGLFIVKTYIERWGGHVGIISEENKGTTVYFELPLKNENNINS